MNVEKANILVADDDLTTLVLMRATLERGGYVVDTVENGIAAMRQFRAGQYDLVMLDIDMPDISGLEVCKELRHLAGQALPIVMVTGMDAWVSVDAAYRAGATDFLAKPINWALIEHRVKYLLRSYQNFLDLTAAEERNAAIIRALPDLLFEVDEHGRYVVYHPPRSDQQMSPTDSPVGKSIYEVLPKDAATICADAMREAALHGLSVGREINIRTMKGPFWYELSVSPKTKASISGKSVGQNNEQTFIILARDITARRAAEEPDSALSLL